MKASSIVGNKYGLLTVIERCGTKPNGRKSESAWLCHCGCGRQKVVARSALIKGLTRSCGCLHEKWVRGTRKHGHAKKGANTVEYRTWASIIARCYNPKHKDFRSYGGRGIGVCREWRDNSAVFLAFMGPRPSAQHSIERIDCDGDYEPSNCKWATTREQSRNRRNNRWVTVGDQTLLIGDWAEKIGLDKSTIYLRIRRGWPLELAVSLPPKAGKYVGAPWERRT